MEKRCGGTKHTAGVLHSGVDMPPMHRSRGAASVTAPNGCLYAVGGYDSGASILEGVNQHYSNIIYGSTSDGM